MDMSLYTFGAISLVVVAVVILWRFMPKTRKNKAYISLKPKSNMTVLIVFGLIMIGYASYAAFHPEGEIAPKAFGIVIGDIFGGFTPLALILLNPFFAVGVYVISLGITDRMNKSKLSKEGALTIPSNFSLNMMAKDEHGSRDWKLTYQFLDGHRGRYRLKGLEFVNWSSIVHAVLDNELGKEDTAHYLLVQYLPESPGTHQLWQTAYFPPEMLATSRMVMADEPETIAIIEKAMANGEAGKYPVSNLVQEPMEQIAPAFGIKGKDGLRRSPFMSIIVWGFIALFVLVFGFVIVMQLVQ